MKKYTLFLFLGILALSAFLRFYRITEIPLGLYPDEAMNGNNALEALYAPRPDGGFKVFYPENNGREGLFINIQALSIAAFGATPWALRIVSTLIGTLTILGMYLVAKELLRNYESGIRTYETELSSPNSLFIIPNSNIIGLLAAFFLATSYWHLNFSRIGFRAIMLPLFAAFGMYFLLRGLRTAPLEVRSASGGTAVVSDDLLLTGYRNKIYLILAGILTGLGVHTYIAFRFMVFVFTVPVVHALWRGRKAGKAASAVSSIAIYAAAALIVLAPLGLYFFQHPAAFANRAGDVSIFSAAAPAKEFLISAGKTIGMLFWQGDCNWRHNFNCRPQLNPLIALFFIIGLVSLVRVSTNYKLQATSLFMWLFAMMLPAVLTREGSPHALRSIGMIPPVMILAALGTDRIRGAINVWSARQKAQWPAKTIQLERIRRELLVLLGAVLLILPLMTYRDYFIRWAEKPETYDAFDTSSVHLGEYLAELPRETKKYVIVNRPGTLVRGIPMPSQTVMFITDTFREEVRREKGFAYIIADEKTSRRAAMTNFKPAQGERFVITFLDGLDGDLISAFRKKYPELKTHAPGDFIILQNYSQ